MKHEICIRSATENYVKTIEIVQCLLASAQIGFIATKERLRVLSIEMEEREMDLRRTKLMCSDRKSIAEFDESEVLKVKVVLECAHQYVDQ